MVKRILIACALGLTVMSAGAAQATLIGNTVGLDFRQPGNGAGQVISNAGTATVNGSQILTLLNAQLTVTATQAIFTFINAPGSYPVNSFSGFALYDYTSPITAFTIDPTTNLSGFVAGDAFIAQGAYLFLNFEGLHYTTSSKVVINLGTVASPLSAPEPASLAIIGVGLAALGLARRKRTV